MNIKELNQFSSLMKNTDKVSDTVYKMTTEKRRTVIVPEGVMVYDQTEKKNYIGDGTTRGGLSGSAKLTVRVVPIDAAASAGLSANPTTDKVTWTTKGATLRTGDALTFAAGGQTIPTGLSAAAYYVIKPENDPAAESFKVATTRANALAGTAVNITTSGVAGYTAVVAQVAVQGYEDVLLLDPVGAAVTVYLPFPETGVSPQVTVKRAAAGNVNVTIAALDTNGAAATLTCDNSASNITMGSGSLAYGYTLFGDPASGEWFTIGKVIS